MFPNIFAVIFSTTQTKSKTIHKNFNPPQKKGSTQAEQLLCVSSL